MTIKELAESYDQSADIVKKCVTSKLKISQALFIHGVPNKIIHHVLRRLGFTDIKRINISNNNVVSPLPIITLAPTIESKHLNAVKADDAYVDTYIWDERVIAYFSHIKYEDEVVNKLNVLRRFFQRLWIRKVWRSFMIYLSREYGIDWISAANKYDGKSELYKDINRFADCAYRASGSTWFEWKMGSTLFFWRWPREFRKMARDGIPYWFKGNKLRFCYEHVTETYKVLILPNG